MRYRISHLFCAWVVLVVIWILELVTFVLGLLHIPGDHFEPEEIFYVGLLGGPVLSAVALLILVIPLTLSARFLVRRFRWHQAMPYILFFGVSILFAGVWDLVLKHPFDAGSFGCRVLYVLAGSSALWFMSRRHEQVV
jgi:hypothetical protein